MSCERKERVSISLFPSTLKLVNNEASKQNRSKSNLIETILQSYFGIEDDIEERMSESMARSLR